MNDKLIDICHALNDDLRKLAEASVTLGKVLYSNVNEMSSVTSSMMNQLERFIMSNPTIRSTSDSANSDCHTPSFTLPKSDIRVKQLFPENKSNAPSSANIPKTDNSVVNRQETNSTKLLLSMKTKLNDQLLVRNNVHRRKPAARSIIRKLVSLKPNALQTNLLKKPDAKSYMNAMVRCKYCPQMLALTHVKYHMYIRHNGPGNYKYKRNPKNKQMPPDAEFEDDDPSATATPDSNDMNQQISQCSAAASSDLPTMVVMNSLTPLNLQTGGGTATTPSADCSSSSSTKGFPQNYTDCSVCGLHLHKRRLYEHMRETHDNTGLKYKCPCCYKLYISPIALRTHVIRSPQCSAFNRTKRYGSLASYQVKLSPTSRDAAVDVPTSTAPESSLQTVLASPVATSSSASEDVRRGVSQNVVRSSSASNGGGSRTNDSSSLFRCQLCCEAFTTPQGCKVHIFRRHGVKAHTLSSV